MGLAASSCMGRRRRRGKYNLNNGSVPRRVRINDRIGLGMLDEENVNPCIRFRSYEGNPPVGVAKTRDMDGFEDLAALSDNKTNGSAEQVGRSWCEHVHQPLPRGVDDAVRIQPHPDLPDGVACITCAATMVEKDQDMKTGESSELSTQPAGGEKVSIEKNSDIPTKVQHDKHDKTISLTENADGLQQCTGHGEPCTEVDKKPVEGGKLSRTSRRRRRHAAYEKAMKCAV